MRVASFVIAGGLAGVTVAQLGGVPSCAQPCVLEFTSGSEIAGCNAEDIACICSNQNFLSEIACCMVPVCDQADQNAAVAYAKQLCDTVGVTNLPNSVGCSTTTQSSTATSSGPTTSVSTTTAASSASTTPVGTTSSTSSKTSSSTPSASKNVGPMNVAGVGAGILGGLAAVVGAIV